MKRTILCFFALFFSITVFCQHSYKQSLKNVATIVFPDKPDTTKTKRGVTYSVYSYNSVLMAHVSKLNKSLGDVFTNDLQDSVYFGVLKGIKSIGGTVFNKKYINIYGLHGMEFAYKMHDSSATPYCYAQTFYFNDIFIINSFKSIDSLRTDDKKIKAFFSTFKVTIPDNDIEQRTFADIAFSTRTWVISILILLMGVLIMYGVYIIKKRSYNN